jgi:hypothetical protein
MRAETQEWLTPITEAAIAAGIDITSLLEQSAMPADPWPTRLEEIMRQVEGVQVAAVEWISYGQQILTRLREIDPERWDGYPSAPGEDE